MRKRITAFALMFLLLITGLTACAVKDSFNFSIDKYVKQYNSYYRADFGEDYLKMSEEEITKLCSKAVKEGYDNAKENGDSVPYALYHSGNIGITTHFAIGESQHLCIIPVTGKIIKEYKDKGVKIIDIEQ